MFWVRKMDKEKNIIEIFIEFLISERSYFLGILGNASFLLVFMFDKLIDKISFFILGVFFIFLLVNEATEVDKLEKKLEESYSRETELKNKLEINGIK
jgi:large-conductance mechanosensitive channel